MPKLIAGVLHFMRDHMLGNPEPELTERYGKEHTPNACGICHSDRSPRWAREWKDRWWRPAPRALIENVGLVVDLRKRVPVDPRRIDRMAQDSNNRLFFRLTAIQELALRHDSVSRASLRRLLSDEQDEVRQLASLGIAEDPHPEAATTLERLLDDPCRVVRVEAAYALARCGWRGNSAKMERAYGDALKMRERQRSFDDILERLATLADALEREKEMTEHLRLLSGRQTAIRTSGDLLNRYARVLIEEGHFQKALEFCEQSEAHYARKHGALEPMFQQRLFLDFADSLAALGRQKEALKYWEKVGTIAPQDSLAAIIAAARKMALLGQAEPERHEVESALGRFSDDLAVGELRRRALWTLKVLESVKDTH
jgi:tetratricopeptide (TPR) repeat protein